jgi:hypothetical protein
LLCLPVPDQGLLAGWPFPFEALLSEQAAEATRQRTIAPNHPTHAASSSNLIAVAQSKAGASRCVTRQKKMKNFQGSDEFASRANKSLSFR